MPTHAGPRPTSQNKILINEDLGNKSHQDKLTHLKKLFTDKSSDDLEAILQNVSHDLDLAIEQLSVGNVNTVEQGNKLGQATKDDKSRKEDHRGKRNSYRSNQRRGKGRQAHDNRATKPIQTTAPESSWANILLANASSDNVVVNGSPKPTSSLITRVTSKEQMDQGEGLKDAQAVLSSPRTQEEQKPRRTHTKSGRLSVRRSSIPPVDESKTQAERAAARNLSPTQVTEPDTQPSSVTLSRKASSFRVTKQEDAVVLPQNMQQVNTVNVRFGSLHLGEIVEKEQSEETTPLPLRSKTEDIGPAMLPSSQPLLPPVYPMPAPHHQVPINGETYSQLINAPNGNPHNWMYPQYYPGDETHVPPMIMPGYYPYVFSMPTTPASLQQPQSSQQPQPSQQPLQQPPQHVPTFPQPSQHQLQQQTQGFTRLSPFHYFEEMPPNNIHALGYNPSLPENYEKSHSQSELGMAQRQQVPALNQYPYHFLPQHVQLPLQPQQQPLPPQQPQQPPSQQQQQQQPPQQGPPAPQTQSMQPTLQPQPLHAENFGYPYWRPA